MLPTLQTALWLKRGMMRIDVRRVKKEDLPKIAEIERLCFSSPWDIPSLQSDIGMGVSRAYLAFGEDGNCLGYILVHVVADEAEVARVAVLPESRRMGVATALLDAAFSSFGGNVYLEVRAGNAAAIALYTKAGFIKTGVRKGYYANPAEDAIMMKKEYFNRGANYGTAGHEPAEFSAFEPEE